MQDVTHNIGKTIADLRRERGWTQAELAEKLNVSDKAVSKWEKGSGLPSVDFFPRLAELFGISIDYIMTGKSEQVDPLNEKCDSACDKGDGMSLCKKCGAGNPEDAVFCSKCGAKLGGASLEKCGSCGAKVSEDAVFCSNCGARLTEPEPYIKKCAACGTELSKDSVYCPECGARAGEPCASRRAPASGKRVKDRVADFERTKHYISNIAVMCIAVVLIFVSLFCPIRFYGVSPDMLLNAENESKTVDSSQSIYQILGALDYVDLDADDPADYAKIKESLDKYSAVVLEAQNKYLSWAKNHPDASNEEKSDKLNELTADAIKDINYYAYVFSYTTVGAYDKYTGTKVEANMDSLLVTMRDSAIFGIVIAAICAFTHIAIAALALVFLVFAILGTVKRRRFVSPYRLLSLIAVMSGAMLALLMIAPKFSAGGGMFAISLFSVLTYFAFTAVNAFLSGKRPACVIKHTVFCAISIVSAFLLTAHVLQLGLRASALNASGELEYADGTVLGPLGNAVYGLVAATDLTQVIEENIKLTITFSTASIAGSVLSVLLCVGAFASMYAAMMRSLHTLARDPESKKRSGLVLMIFGAALAVLFAIVPAAIGAASEAPTPASVREIGVLIKFSARLPVFFAIGYSVAAVFFALLYNVKTPTASLAVTAAPEEIAAETADRSGSAAKVSDEHGISEEAR